jgi:hypothetical protein
LQTNKESKGGQRWPQAPKESFRAFGSIMTKDGGAVNL